MVLGDGEHHVGQGGTWDFFGRHDRIYSLRPHPHAETDKKASKGNFAASGAGRTSTSCFALEEERGGNWKGSGGSVPAIKEAKPSL